MVWPGAGADTGRTSMAGEAAAGMAELAVRSKSETAFAVCPSAVCASRHDERRALRGAPQYPHAHKRLQLSSPMLFH